MGEGSFAYGYSVIVSGGLDCREVVDDVFDLCISLVEGTHQGCVCCRESSFATEINVVAFCFGQWASVNVVCGSVVLRVCWGLG